MVRNSGKMALYEAIGESRGRLHDGHRPVNLKETETAGAAEQIPHKSDKAKTTVKVKLTPKQIIIGLLSILLLLCLLIKIVQLVNRHGNEPEAREAQTVQSVKSSEGYGRVAFVETIKTTVIPAEEKRVETIDRTAVNHEMPTQQPVSMGDNAIVVVTYQVLTDLEPVKAYFAENGIQLEIIKKGIWYYLITQTRYSAEDFKSGGKLEKDLDLIKKVGAGYKSPGDFESFGSRPFQDAYAKKIK